MPAMRPGSNEEDFIDGHLRNRLDTRKAARRRLGRTRPAAAQCAAAVASSDHGSNGLADVVDVLAVQRGHAHAARVRAIDAELVAQAHENVLRM